MPVHILQYVIVIKIWLNGDKQATNAHLVVGGMSWDSLWTTADRL